MDTMKPMTQHSELISALADGQLASGDFARALAACEADAQALDSWNTYHLIGDVLRSPELIPHAADTAFVARLRVRLSQEPVLVAAPALPEVRHAPAGRAGWTEAANDASFPWKLVAGFASVAAVAAIAWNTGAGLLSPSAVPQLARSEPAAQQVLVVSEQGTLVRDARTQELLAAHRQLGGASALQMPSGFLRNATFESPLGERR
ncbi:MAG: sigma-E factor negative regulatory protein [Polaromonas sp.]|uniref:sigma-E factor negative regulatory protein n=2 Tax=Polaromonas sp. TaxID=1869339 RepID=UPI00272F1FEB|nr:sigma-E factor negative regulatory protein [Polaromonas sp.]MDP2450150.1 sigma-E factor negative regulatory protein [Polaromonas sp.]MDP3246996.1 sigma-E factor negative regulatory protein [Polaromonas sp.]MDP3757622.1 sigma-E factor negative regulatory protein [Polaromonas sp.]